MDGVCKRAAPDARDWAGIVPVKGGGGSGGVRAVLRLICADLDGRRT